MTRSKMRIILRDRPLLSPRHVLFVNSQGSHTPWMQFAKRSQKCKSPKRTKRVLEFASPITPQEPIPVPINDLVMDICKFLESSVVETGSPTASVSQVSESPPPQASTPLRGKVNPLKPPDATFLGLNAGQTPFKLAQPLEASLTDFYPELAFPRSCLTSLSKAMIDLTEAAELDFKSQVYTIVNCGNAYHNRIAGVDGCAYSRNDYSLLEFKTYKCRLPNFTPPRADMFSVWLMGARDRSVCTTLDVIDYYAKLCSCELRCQQTSLHKANFLKVLESYTGYYYISVPTLFREVEHLGCDDNGKWDCSWRIFFRVVQKMNHMVIEYLDPRKVEDYSKYSKMVVDLSVYWSVDSQVYDTFLHAFAQQFQEIHDDPEPTFRKHIRKYEQINMLCCMSKFCHYAQAIRKKVECHNLVHPMTFYSRLVDIVCDDLLSCQKQFEVLNMKESTECSFMLGFSDPRKFQAEQAYKKFGGKYSRYLEPAHPSIPWVFPAAPPPLVASLPAKEDR